MNNRAHSSAIELQKSTDCLLKQLPDPSLSRRLTFGRHHSGTKIAEKETGSIPQCSTAAIGAPQTSRAWSGPQQSYSGGARLVEGKPITDSRREPYWRFPGRKAPSVLMPLFWLAQWVAHISALGINNLDVHSET